MVSKLIFFLAALSSILAAQEKPINVISNGGAGWTCKGGPIGASCPANSDVAGKSPTAPLVLDCEQLGLVSYSCPNANCSFRVCSTQAEGVTIHKLEGEAFDGVSQALAKRESNTTSPGARAGGSPTDTLVLSDERGVHWGPALRRILEGHYCFRLTHLGKAREAKTFAIDWDSGMDPEGIAVVPGLTPGGYVLEKGTSTSCTPDPEASPAWVVIAPSATYAQMKAEWGNTAKWLDQLGTEGANLPTITKVRRGALAGMAEIVERR